MEIELKFALARPSAKTAPRSAIAALSRLAGADAPAVERLDSVYFDTTAHELLAAARGGRTVAAAGEVLGWFDHNAVTLEKRAARAAKKLSESRVFW